MKLEGLNLNEALTRPIDNKRNVDDGAYIGEIMQVELVERDSTYSKDGKQVVVNLKVEVVDENGETVDLYLAPRLTWSKQGKLWGILEKLDALPAPGERLQLEVLVGVPVEVSVENVEKDDETYSNIMSMKRYKKSVVRNPMVKNPIGKRKAPAKVVKARRIFDPNATADYVETDLFGDPISSIDDDMAEFFD